MALVIKPLSTDTVTVNGEAIAIRSLSRAEVQHAIELRKQDEVDETEVFTIAAATGDTADQARAWLNSVTFDQGDELLMAIWKLSGMSKPGESEDPKG